jgi:hypothetical protein
MVGVEHLAGVYLANPPAIRSPAIAIVVLAILVAAAAYQAWKDDLAHR